MSITVNTSPGDPGTASAGERPEHDVPKSPGPPPASIPGNDDDDDDNPSEGRPLAAPKSPGPAPEKV